LADALPDIDIAVAGEASRFLEAMAEIGIASGCFDVGSHRMFADG
jgi:hypothetical protein